MCPRSGFWYRRSVLCTLVPGFGVSRSVFVPSFRFWGSRGRLPKTTTLLETTLLRTFEKVLGRRAEQAKARFDPRVGPREAPRECPREPPQEHPRGLISLISALRGLPTKAPTKHPRRCPRKGPRMDGRGSLVLFSPVLFFDQHCDSSFLHSVSTDLEAI